MTFRDDQEAQLRRADALEREAERLRRENIHLWVRPVLTQVLLPFATVAPVATTRVTVR